MNTNNGSALGVIAIVFVILKLTNNIDWSWWWVTLPIWITPVVFIALFICILPIATIRTLRTA